MNVLADLAFCVEKKKGNIIHDGDGDGDYLQMQKTSAARNRLEIDAILFSIRRIYNSPSEERSTTALDQPVHRPSMYTCLRVYLVCLPPITPTKHRPGRNGKVGRKLPMVRGICMMLQVYDLYYELHITTMLCLRLLEN